MVTTWPLLWKKTDSVKVAKIAILSVFIFSIFFNLPKFFFWHEINRSCNQTTTNLTQNMNNTDEVCHVTKLRDHVVYHQVYMIGCHWLVLYILPLGLLIFLNIRLIRQIRRAKATQQSLAPVRRCQRTGGQGIDKESTSVTLNVIAIVTVFMVCQTPDFLLNVLSYPGLNLWSYKTHTEIRSVVYIFLALNSSVNFIIYYLFHRSVRKNVIIMCCSKKCAQRLLENQNTKFRHHTLCSTQSQGSACMVTVSNETAHELQGLTHTTDGDELL